MFNPGDPTPEISIDISLGDFHDTHNKAAQAKNLVAKGVAHMSLRELKESLSALRAAQHLSDAETCSVDEDIPQYGNFIHKVEREIKKRKAR